MLVFTRYIYFVIFSSDGWEAWNVLNGILVLKAASNSAQMKRTHLSNILVNVKGKYKMHNPSNIGAKWFQDDIPLNQGNTFDT